MRVRHAARLIPLGAMVLVALLAGGCKPSGAPSSENPPAAVEPPSRDWSQAPATSEERLCADFMRLKNSGDPAAAALLGPPPTVPDGPVSREEADRLDTVFFLHQDIHFTGVGKAAKPGQLVLCAKGSASAPELRVQSSGGVDVHQRVLFNPDVTVEVRDGRIDGVSCSAHLGP